MEQKRVECAGDYSIIQGLGSVNPYSYPYCHVWASDFWCRRQSDVRVEDTRKNNEQDGLDNIQLSTQRAI